MPQVKPGTHVLDPDKIVSTVEKLRTRIEERFPRSGLSQVAADLTLTAVAEVAARSDLGREIWQKHLILRGSDACGATPG